MAAIAGIAAANRKKQVNQMLDRMANRGQAGRLVVQPGGVTLGIDWPEAQPQAFRLLLEQNLATDPRAGNWRHLCTGARPAWCGAALFWADR